jgi:DNA polymerase-3 subunit gamma/tau
VIDEVHMLSSSAFNAMLKTLEEPPEHVKFILATTDPQKIPVTVLSRCLQFNLKQMTVPAIVAHLQKILGAEKIVAEDAALTLVARSAAGSMRDALSLLDQAIAHGAGHVEEAAVRDMLGTVDLDHLYNILEALLAGDAAKLLATAEAMAERSLSFDLALQELASVLTQIQVEQLAPAAFADDSGDGVRLRDFAARLDPEYVQLAYQIAVHGRRDLPLAPDENAGFVMTLLRLFAFRPQLAATSSPAPKSPTPAPGPERKPVAPPVRVATVEEPAAAPFAPDAAPPPLPLPVDAAPPPLPPPLPVQSPAAPAAAPAAAAETLQGLGDWTALLAELKIGGMARELAQHCELRRSAANEIVLRLSSAHRHLLMRTAQDKLQQVLSDHLKRSLKLAIEIGEVDVATPAETNRQVRREIQDRAVAAIEQDGFVRGAIELFDAHPIESSIKPI